MQVTIHRGTRQIGGSCIEIASGGDRILLDLGQPLAIPGEDGPTVYGRPVAELIREGVLPDVAGVYRNDIPGLRAVVLSHAHQDHTGLAGFVHSDIPVLATTGTWALADAIAPFVPNRDNIFNRQVLHRGRPRRFGSLRITAVPVDHSAPDAAALYVEGGDRNLLYTGDLRAHGKKGYLFDDLICRYAGKVHTLLVEGTTVGRPGHDCTTESDIGAEFENRFRHQKGLSLVFCSGQNLDRIVVIFRAAKKTGKTLVIDLYTAYTLHKLAYLSANIPQWNWPGIKIIAWPYQERSLRKAQQGGFVDVTKTAKKWTSIAVLKDQGDRHVLLMRANRMMNSLESKLGEKTKDVDVIWSMWDGYRKHDRHVGPFCERHGVNSTYIHTSGHAPWPDLIRLIKGLQPEVIVPVHTERAQVFAEHFENVFLPRDGEPFQA